MDAHPPLSPFTEESDRQKVRLAEDGRNSRNPTEINNLLIVNHLIW